MAGGLTYPASGRIHAARSFEVAIASLSFFFLDGRAWWWWCRSRIFSPIIEGFVGMILVINCGDSKLNELSENIDLLFLFDLHLLTHCDL